MDKIKLVVYNEYALGYIMPEQPDKVCTLADRVTLGAPSDWQAGKTSTRSGYRSRGTTIRRCTSMTPIKTALINQTIN